MGEKVPSDPVPSDPVPSDPEQFTIQLEQAEMAMAEGKVSDTNTPITREVDAAQTAEDYISMAIGIAIGTAFCAVFVLLVVLMRKRKGGEEREDKVEAKEDDTASDKVTS